MNNLYEALENCLQDIERGADVETVLFRYPDLADELRPILEASANAKSMAVPAPSAEVVRRNRAKVLQHAAQWREGRIRSSQRMWFASLRRFAVTVAVVAMLFMSGTGLVRAAADTVPGDNLYPVKRTWEDVLVLFTFNPQEREVLEVEHENERLQEVQELFAEGRSAGVDFNGLVTSQTGNEWVVAGVRVLISSQTQLGDQGIVIGSPVRVRGLTQGNNTVLAERITLLSPSAKLPVVDDQHEAENENSSGSVTGDEKPQIEETQTPETDTGSENSNFDNGNDSSTNDNYNENISEDSNSNDQSINSNKDSSNINESGTNENSDQHNANDSGGDSHSNDNENDSSGGDNSNSDGGGGGTD